MSSRRTKLKNAKSLPDLKGVKKMPTASQSLSKQRAEITGKCPKTPTRLPYCEEHYSPRVLVGTWQERRILDSLPKVPFQNAFMLGDSDRRPATAYASTRPSGENLRRSIDEAYKTSRTQCIKNRLAASAESPADIYHPQPGTPLHDEGAAWHSLYHQTYTLQNPKLTASQAHVQAIGAPEIHYGLAEKKVAKWAQQKADAADFTWSSTYQKSYPTLDSVKMPNVERKYINSQWRSQAGNLVIGNPHVEGMRQPSPARDSRRSKSSPPKPRGLTTR